MTPRGPQSINRILYRISSLKGGRDFVQSEIFQLFSQLAGFQCVKIELAQSNSSFSVEIEDSGKWLNIDAQVCSDGYAENEWQLMATVAAGALARVEVRVPSCQLLASVVIVKDREGRFLEVNQPFADLYGTTCEEMIGRTDADFHNDSEMCDRYLKDDQRAILSGEPVHILNEKNSRLDEAGSARFETVKVPLKNESGEFDRVMVIATPQTEERSNAFALKFQNSFLFKMIDISPNWVSVKDRDGRFVYANESFCQVMGKSRSEIIGQTDALLTPDSQTIEEFVKDDLEVINSRQEKFIREEKVTNHQGEVIWVQTVKKPVIEIDGTCDKVLLVCVPITEQRIAAAKIEENRQFLREVIDSNPSLILVKNRDGKILLANESAASFYGVEKSDLIGKSDADFNSNVEELESFRAIEEEVFQSGKLIHIEAEHVTDSEGNQHWFKTTKKPIESKRNTDELLVVCTDITEEVAAKESLQKAKEQAVRASFAKSEFLTRMSHELRTPLNAILGFNQLLQQDENLNREQLDTLEIVNKSGKHLLNLISDVLEMSKVEMGKLELNLGSVDFPKLVKGTVALVSERAAANDCQLSCEIAADVPVCIEGDEVKLRQVILNLISNAVKFTNDGEVKVMVERSSYSKLKVSVVDNGVGIAESEIDQVFGLFRQTESGRKSEEGAGLGLSISKSLINLMKGEIGVVSKEGEGSTFFFEIPFNEVVLPKSDSVTVSKESQPKGDGLKVLVVDDVEMNRTFLTRLLMRLGYETIEAVNGVEAVKSHLDERPDLILMDVKMPDMDGMTATATIRENESLNQIDRVPIIAVTANAFEEHRRRASEVGCDGFVAKPFEFADLVDAISAQVETPQ